MRVHAAAKDALTRIGEVGEWAVWPPQLAHVPEIGGRLGDGGGGGSRRQRRLAASRRRPRLQRSSIHRLALHQTCCCEC